MTRSLPVQTILTSPLLLDNLLRKLQDSLSVLSPELIPIHERLVNLRRQLVALAAKETAREAARVAEQDYKGKSVVAAEPSRSASESEAESKTPTRESTPKPSTSEFKEKDKDTLRLKAELKPIQEELRKIDGLSIFSCCVRCRSLM